MKKSLISLFCTLLSFSLASSSTTSATNTATDSSFKNDNLSYSISDSGTLNEITFTTEKGIEKVTFRTDDWKGPSFGKDIVLSKDPQTNSYSGNKEGITYKIEYIPQNKVLTVKATVKNTTDKDYTPEKLPFTLGIDTYMNKYPEWTELYFPTFFRCEKESFWGYMMSPNGKILTITSPDPIASYTINYLNEMYGHYIYTVTLDLLCSPPLPTHHPKLVKLAPGEEKSWEITLSPVKNIREVEEQVAQSIQTPLLKLSSHSLEPGQEISITTLTSGKHNITITPPSGRAEVLTQENTPLTYTPKVYGLYQLSAENERGKVATASFYVRPPWSWYIQQARLQAIHQAPRADKGNDSCETWYGLFAPYLAEKYFPDKALTQMSDDILNEVHTQIFKEEGGKRHSTTYSERVQNVSAMLSILVDKYEATHSEDALQKAVECAEYILSRQHEKGYYGGYGMAHYTSVIYVAKSILELMDAVKPLAKKDPVWKERYNRYDQSTKRAIDELSTRGRDIHTEGQATYEDGAVSCSAAQLLTYALRQSDTEKKNTYLKPGLEYLDDHACLTRLLDPDARSRGATSRFWECWGDIRSPFQAMLSPHGWSGWRLYPSYYAYLLTGDEQRLQDFIDAMGTCTQLLNFPQGEILYAFIIDPQINAGELIKDSSNPNGNFIKKKMGSCYLRNISDWFGKRTEGEGYLDKASWDWAGQTTYEIIKAMEETVLTQAFVCEKSDGSYIAYNCSIKDSPSGLTITPSENIITKVHINLKKPKNITIPFASKTIKEKNVSGMKWLSSPDSTKVK